MRSCVVGRVNFTYALSEMCSTGVASFEVHELRRSAMFIDVVYHSKAKLHGSDMRISNQKEAE